MQETEAFLKIKDHKEGFPSTLSFRLINPSKADIGKISKSLLNAINENIFKQNNVNQWKNTAQVITWFKNLKSKKTSRFVNFDIENFYPSISIDVTFDLVNGIYKPYSKPNNKPLYINGHSNQPLNILKQLPKSIETHISETSLNIDVFNRSIKLQ